MNITSARTILTPASLQSLDVSRFLAVTDYVKTMARPRFLATMNALASLLDPDERLLEIGTYQGGSLIGALLHNQARAIAVDNFSQFTDTNSLEILWRNIETFGMEDRVKVHPVGCMEYFRSADIPPVGLYYYDGAHDEESTLNGLEAGFPYVVKNGVIVLDDTLYPEVCAGVNRFLGNHASGVKILCAVSPAEEFSADWWNGSLFLQKL